MTFITSLLACPDGLMRPMLTVGCKDWTGGDFRQKQLMLLVSGAREAPWVTTGLALG